MACRKRESSVTGALGAPPFPGYLGSADGCKDLLDDRRRDLRQAVVTRGVRADLREDSVVRRRCERGRAPGNNITTRELLHFPGPPKTDRSLSSDALPQCFSAD